MKQGTLRDLYQNTVFVYLGLIYSKYPELEHEQASILRKGLENLLVETDIGVDLKEPVVLSSEYASILEFQPDIAKRIRVRKGLTQKELGMQVGLSKGMAQPTISKMEKGTFRTHSLPKTQWAKPYFSWLKDEGYDPFSVK
jgi:DNA-binding XRE family transcriptional regulator